MSDYSKIDKQIRWPGQIVSMFMPPTERGMKRVHSIFKYTLVKSIEWGKIRTEQIKRSEGDGDIRTVVFSPKDTSKPMPTVLYLHGGGFAVGYPDQKTSVDLLEGLMAERNCVFVAPDFRNSIDHPYPAGLDDCYDVLVWIKENIDQLGGRSDQIFVMGESGGGGLTMAVCLLARDRGEVNVAFQMPIYPMIDDRHQNPSAVDNNMPGWTTKHNKLAWNLYLRDVVAKGDPTPKYAAPARETDFSNMPPMGTYVGDLETFYDETVALVEAMKSADIPVHFEVYPNCYHGFDLLVPNADVSKRAQAFRHETFAYAVDNYVAEQ